MLANCVIAPGSVNIPASPVSGMLAWYAADQITSPPASGSALAGWNDLSGNGYDATQATSANQPIYNANQLNGLPTLTFNGTTQFLLAQGVGAVSQPVTIYAVVKGTGNRYCAFGSFGAIRAGDANYAGAEIGTANTSSYTVLTSLFNTTSSLIRSNGVQIVSGNVGSNTADQWLAVGAENNSSSGPSGAQFWNGQIAEILLYAGAHTTIQMQQNESYLLGKWGLGAGGGTQQQPAGGLAAIQGAVGRAAVI